MSYKSYQIVEFICGVVCLGAVSVLLAVDAPFLMTIVCALIPFAAMVFTWILCRRKHPQWKEFQWDIQWKIYVPALVIGLALMITAEVNDWRIGGASVSSLVLFLILGVRPSYELWLMNRFEIDRFNSAEEMIAVHPEAKAKIYKMPK